MTPEQLNHDAAELFDKADEFEGEVDRIKRQLERAKLARDEGKPFDSKWYMAAVSALHHKMRAMHVTRRQAAALRKQARALNEQRRIGDYMERRQVYTEQAKAAAEFGRKVYQLKLPEHLWRDVNAKTYEQAKAAGAVTRIVYVTEDTDDHGRTLLDYPAIRQETT